MSWVKSFQRGSARRATFLETRKSRLSRIFRQLNVRVFLGLLLSSVMLFVLAQAGANAAAGDPAFEMYLDAPFVQNSYVQTQHASDPGTFLSNFDSGNNFDPCQVNGATVTLLTQTTGCWLWDEPTYGGAITESSEPTVGNLPAGTSQSRLRYAQANGTQGVRLEFSEPQRYFGIWWSAGSVGNIVTFYSGSKVIAQTTADDVASLISSNSTLQSTGGAEYASSLYLGNPAAWSASGNPTDFSQQDPNNSYVHGDTNYAFENFAYLHFFAQGSVTFDRVELSAPGNGFEFDNIVTSSLSGLTASDRLVHVKTVNQPVMISFDANGAQGSLPNQTSDKALPWDCPDYSGQATSNCMIRPPGEFGERNNPFYFDHWNTQADGSGTSLYPGDAPNVEADSILYAQWLAHFYLDPSPPNQEWNYEELYVPPTRPYVLPNELELTGSSTNPGFHIDHWVFHDSGWNDVSIGSPGQSVSADELVTFLQNDYVLRAVWVDGDRPTGQAAPSAVVTAVVPVDPRAVSASLPEMPLIDATSASVCVVEVDTSLNPVSPTLTFTPSGSVTANRTPSVSVSGTEALVAHGPRYLRYRVAADGDSSCTSANDYYLQLKPLNLSDKRSSNADIN